MKHAMMILEAEMNALAKEELRLLATDTKAARRVKARRWDVLEALETLRWVKAQRQAEMKTLRAKMKTLVEGGEK